MNLLEVRNLSVATEDKQILKGINLTIRPGEVHVIMGPNGAGKSTLANAIMAHPKYTVTEGEMLFEGEDLLPLTADERARKGIFMSFQAPKEVAGISVEDFLRTAKSQTAEKSLPILSFKRELQKRMQGLEIDPKYADRYLNVGFSGGEKKKMEILQMQVLDPKLILLDETDSGLDVDAVRVVSQGVADFLTEDKGCLIITHHNEILTALKPDIVHVIIDGRLVLEGGPELIDRIQTQGYEWVRAQAESEAAHA